MNTGKRNRLFLILSLVLFACIVAIALTILEAFDLHPIRRPASAAVSSAVESQPVESGVSAGDPLTGKADADYLSETLFIGDFVPAAMTVYNILDDEQVAADVRANITNIGTLKLTVGDRTMTARKAIRTKKPKQIYLSIGSNDVDWRTRESLTENYADYVRSVQDAAPDAKLYLMAIPPVTADCDRSGSPYTNAKVDRFNRWIQSVAEETGAYYLDVNTVLKGDNDALPNALAESDGYHLRSAGYQMILDYLLSHTAG